jgi:hypothetical protein
MSPPRAINGNISSQPPDQHVTTIRRVELVALPYACGMCLGSATVVYRPERRTFRRRTRRARGTFQNEATLVLALMNVHRRAIAGLRGYLDGRIGAVRLRRRHTYEATLSQPCLQPLVLCRRRGYELSLLLNLSVQLCAGVVRCVCGVGAAGGDCASCHRPERPPSFEALMACRLVQTAPAPCG